MAGMFWIHSLPALLEQKVAGTAGGSTEVVTAKTVHLNAVTTQTLNFTPSNILVIDFGQLGDVVLSLPALGAIRKRFPRARITVAVGKPGAEVVGLSGFADETLVVDRVALRDGFKPLSVLRVFKIVKEVRAKQFDF